MRSDLCIQTKIMFENLFGTLAIIPALDQQAIGQRKNKYGKNSSIAKNLSYCADNDFMCCVE